MENVQQVLPLHKHNRLTALQRSLAYRLTACVEAEAARLSAGCRFFKESDDLSREEIAIFHRDEIQTCGFLGNGAFSEVHQVGRFQLSDIHEPAQEHVRDHIDETAIHQDGSCRYVLKHLRRDKTENINKFVQAAADLVMEAKFLTNINHPNIVKLRGWSGGPFSFKYGNCDSFFLILDRLDETLSHRMLRWKMETVCSQQDKQEHAPKDYSFYGEKLNIGLQIASALDYLHDHDIIFRDLKPDNIGFKNDTVQIFDFGLARELPKAPTDVHEVFHMSGVGTRRYMAPEVCLGEHYNLKADVYSWTMVFYAMLALERPYYKYNAAVHKLLVCDEGVRPSIPEEFPIKIQELFKSGWAPSHMDRPTIKDVCMELRDMIDLTKPKDSVVRQTDTKPSLNIVDKYTQNVVVKLNEKLAGLFRTLETHIIEGTSCSVRDNYSTNYPHLQHLRSSYL